MRIRAWLTHHWKIPVTLLAIFFVYFSVINLTLDENLEKSQNYQVDVQTIVAYSLLKQIEIDGEEYECDEQVLLSAGNYSFGTEGTQRSNGTFQGNVLIEEDIWTHVNGTNLYVSSVNLDKRLEPYHYIRIIGVVKGDLPTPVFCQFPTTTRTYRYIKATITPIWSESWDQEDNTTYYNPILISCRIPFSENPTSVSLTSVPCKAWNTENFEVSEPQVSRTDNYITVCVKPLDFSRDISQRLIQWIEIIKILGADKIEMYVYQVEAKVLNILEWYRMKYPHEITIRKFTTPSPRSIKTDFSQTIWQKRRYEILTYNNCFYRNHHISKYVVPLDIDEIIVPVHTCTWKTFLKKFRSFNLDEKYASFITPNAYFFTKPKEDAVFFFENTFRSDFSPEGESGKSFIISNNSLTIFNHYALHTLKPKNVRAYFLSSDDIQLNHYKESCNSVILPECTKYISSPKVNDTVILKFQRKFMTRYKKVLTEMKKLNILL